MNKYTVMRIDYSTFSLIQVPDIEANNEEEAMNKAIALCAQQGKKVSIAPEIGPAKPVIRTR